MTIQIQNPTIEEIAKQTGQNIKEIEEFVELVKRSMRPEQLRIPINEDGQRRYYTVERRGLGPLITPHGTFWQYNFSIDDAWEKYSVLVKGEINEATLNPAFTNNDQLIVRTDSGCETGQMFHDQTCDCRDQLHLAMRTIEQVGEGMIINIPRQDGRGMGLTFKLGTLWLQKHLGVNTVQSAGLLAPDGVIDIRTYAGVIAVLKFFEIPETCVINLATNNPDKIQVFQANGYTVDTMSIVIDPTEHTAHHFAAKKQYLNHKALRVVLREDEEI